MLKFIKSFDHADLRNAMMFMFIEVLVIACAGGYVQANEKVVIPISEEDLIETMELPELDTPTLSIPKTEKAPSQQEKPKNKNHKTKRRVYPISTKLIHSLCLQESGNDPNTKPGDDGKALGILQIHWKYVKDVNKFFGTKYTHEDMLDPDIAKEVCRLYIGYWAYHAQSKGVVITDEICCRIHNGGPYGYIDNGSIVATNTARYVADMKSKGLL